VLVKIERRTVQFLVYGQDGAEFDYGPNELHDAHQAYMDTWSAELVARGPTLSPDGSQHTGSVHVARLADLQEAHRFATEEPYARSGWYAQVSVVPLRECVEGTMWDRPAPGPEVVSSFLIAAWEPVAFECQLLDCARSELGRAGDRPWLFGGLITSEDLSEVSGLVAAIDLAPAEAERQITALLAQTSVPQAAIEAQRWMRGGRSAG
jgi:hypothetical protein